MNDLVTGDRGEPAGRTGECADIGAKEVTGEPPAGTLVLAPGLLPLGDYRGLTPTHALATDSPAIDRGSNPGHFASDQRGVGYPHLFGADTDIGAFEFSQPVVVDRIFANGFD